MHKWKYVGPLEDDSLQSGCPLFECRKCGFQLISYVSNLVKAAEGLYRNNHLLKKCKPKNVR